MTEQHLNDPVTLYVTVPNKEEGIRIGHVLVKSNLVACANVMDNVTSVFSWQGEIQEEAEQYYSQKHGRVWSKMPPPSLSQSMNTNAVCSGAADHRRQRRIHRLDKKGNTASNGLTNTDLFDNHTCRFG